MAHLNIVFDPGFETNFDYPSKTPMYGTIIQKPVSGRGEIRASLQPYPLWKIEYDMQFGRGGEQDANTVYQYVLGFFMNVGGQFSDFLYEDPNDNEVTLAPFATGDGSTTTFQLTRPIGIGTDIVQNLSGTPNIFTPGYDYPNFDNPNATENFLAWSQGQNQSVWSFNGITLGSATAAPDGGLSAWSITANTGTADGFLAQTVVPPNITSGGIYTFSIWLRAESGTPPIVLEILNSAGTLRAALTVTLSNDWDKYTITTPMQPGDTGIQVRVGGGTTWTPAIGTIDVAWAQLETGSNASAYISTQAAAYYYTISFNGIIQFSAPPPYGDVLTWTGRYYYRVRFGDDSTTFDQQFDKIWNNGKITLQSVIL